MTRLRQSLIRLLSPLLVACAVPMVAQTTSVTAPSGSITMGGVPITTGSAVFVPVDVNGHPIAVTKSGGGLNLPGSATNPVGYSCAITAGSLGACNLPDENTSTPSGFRYNVTILDTSSGDAANGMYFTLPQVAGITGASYRLDEYAPTSTVSTTPSLTFTSGSGAPSGACAAPAFYIDTVGAIIYVCINTSWSAVQSSGFSNPMQYPGDLIVGGTNGAATRLAGNSTAVDEVLVSHGTGTAAQGPSYTNAPALSAANMTNLPVSGITGLSGDGSASGPGLANFTLSTSVNSSPGGCGDASHVCQITTNTKGLVPSQSAVAINPTQVNSVSYASGPSVGSVPTATSSTTVDYTAFLAAIPKANCLAGWILTNQSGATVTDWCGNGNNGTIVGSTSYSALGVALNVETTGQYIAAPAAVNTAKTFVIAGYWPTFGSSYGYNWGDATNFGANPCVLCATTSNLVSLITNDPPTNDIAELGLQPETYPFGNSTTNSHMGSGRHVFIFNCAVTGGDAYYYDGVKQPLSTNGNSCPTSTSSGVYQIGGSSQYTGSWANFIASDVFFYSSALTSTQVVTLTNALNSQMDAAGAAALATQSPVMSTTYGPTVVFEGDSRFAGTISGVPITTAVGTLNNGASKILLSYSGSKAQDHCAEGTQSLRSVLPANATGLSIGIIWIGINDIALANGGYTANVGNAVLSRYACMVKNMKSLGMKVILATETAGGGNTYDAAKDYIDPIVRREAATWGADDLMDYGDMPVLSADGASVNYTYFVNGNNLHENATTTTNVLGPIAAAHINEITGSNPYNPTQVSGATYQELSSDDNVELTGSASQTITLPDCQSYSRVREIWNPTAYSATVSPATSGYYATFTQLIDGQSSITVPAHSTWRGRPVPGPTSTGGCSWETVN